MRSALARFSLGVSSPLAVVVVVVVGLAADARADALPPPTPVRCPPGTQIVHDHGGTRCEKDAPTSCPPGWEGIRGGQCVLSVCTSDVACGAGRTCKPATLCSSMQERAVYGEGAAVRGPELAAPPRPLVVRVFTDVCRRGKGCAAPGACRTARVCLPAGADAPADRPANGGERIDYRGEGDGEPFDTGGDFAQPPPTAVPTTTAPADPVGIEPAREPTPPGKSGGCAGCAEAGRGASSSRASGWLAIGLAIAAAATRRRR